MMELIFSVILEKVWSPVINGDSITGLISIFFVAALTGFPWFNSYSVNILFVHYCYSDSYFIHLYLYLLKFQSNHYLIPSSNGGLISWNTWRIDFMLFIQSIINITPLPKPDSDCSAWQDMLNGFSCLIRLTWCNHDFVF